MTNGYAITRDGTSIYYEILGNGEALTLVEGLGYAHWMWKEQLQLSELFKLVIFDNRGAGLSAKPNKPYTMQEFANDMADLLNYLNVKKTFVWGVSMGGMIAMQFAVSYNNMVKGLILGETNFGIYSLPPSKEALEVLLKPPDVTLDKKQAIFERMKVAFSDEFVKNNIKKIEEIVELRMNFEEDPVAYKNQLAATLTFDFKDQMKKIKCPTLIVTGDMDKVVNPSNSYIINQYVPNSKLIVLKGAGHLAIIERAKDYNSIVSSFINEVVSGTFKPSKQPVIL